MRRAIACGSVWLIAVVVLWIPTTRERESRRVTRYGVFGYYTVKESVAGVGRLRPDGRDEPPPPPRETAGDPDALDLTLVATLVVTVLATAVYREQRPPPAGPPCHSG
jgi:hypothetical protein